MSPFSPDYMALVDQIFLSCFLAMVLVARLFSKKS
jgi:hypothetical protein